MIKPRARIFSASALPYVGLPHVPDFYTYDFSNTTGSNANTTHFGSNFDDDDSYILMPVGTSSWYPDSGATHHVCQEVSALNEFTPYSNISPLFMGDGTPTKILCVGNSVLPTKTMLLHLSNDIKTQKILLRGHINDGLYQFSLIASIHSAMVPSTSKTGLQSSTDNCDTFTLWHRRLGHPSSHKGKFHKLPFPYSTTEYNEPFALVVSDLWGPMSVACGNHWYYVSFIDMCNRYTWLYLIQRNSQAVDYFIQFQQLVKTQFGKEIKQFQSDWGGEFHAFKPVLAENRIIHRLSCPHTSEQNGVAERYSSQHKGYQCLTPDGKLILFRHVVFDESRFLFPKTIAESSSSGQCVSTYDPIVASRSTESSLTRPVMASPPTFGSSSTPFVLVHSQDISNSLPTGSTIFRSPFISSDPLTVPQLMGNTHSLVTRSKAEIFKSKAFSIEALNCEPRTINEAFASKEWRLATQAEYDALIHNSTWDLVPLPYGQKVIGCKWLFKVKKYLDGTISYRKAWLVAKGCSQVPGCWQLREVDINNAFLNGDLINKVFMQQPSGYVQYGPNGEPLSDASLFVRVTPASTLYLLVYVDDIIVTRSLLDSINVFVQQLHSEFSLRDMGDLHYFLGIEVERSSTGCLHLCQRKCIRELLDRSGLANAKIVYTPMISSSVLSKNEGNLRDPTEYRSLFGALQYVVLTRPDIAYDVNHVCQFMHAPTTMHLVALKLSLVGYADANWGLDFDDRQLTTSAVAVATNLVLHSEFKHAELNLFFVREKVANGSLVVGEVLPVEKMGECYESKKGTLFEVFKKFFGGGSLY
ncbi:hypothetical protein CXB51_007946 [Gossypium anomalum]|uniref:Integrase catalytic domain-containing protein n=1 Tax=Gossypium anomalum TaxID=47600 RepID=A0A8J6D5N9_9ROSI|nr:hypothetical protein CXB51_007946 [Gossypium anomalum]